MSLHLHLKDHDATEALGKSLAAGLASSLLLPTLMLTGDLGSGKTTLVRALVESLPGAENAEVSSPSFNIFNLYPTSPEVAHFDLYRLEGMPPDEALFEFLGDDRTLVIIEWAQFLDKSHWPDQILHLEWTSRRDGRDIQIDTTGSKANQFLKEISPQLLTHTTESDLK